MGDFADDAIFAGLDQSWGFREPHRARRKPLKICQDCGQRGLMWRNEQGSWFLSELNDSLEWVKHACKLKNAFKK